MIKLIVGISLAIVLLIFLFSIYAKSKRLKEILVNDVSKLKKGKVSQVFIANFQLNDTNRNRVLNYFQSINARVIEGKDDEIIAYVNKFNKAFLYGIFDLEPTKFPIRIIVLSKDTETEIRMDDSYGFQKFKGKVKEVFEQKNKDAFEYYYSKIIADN